MPQIKGKRQGVPNWQPFNGNRVKDIYFYSLVSFNLSIAEIPSTFLTQIKLFLGHPVIRIILACLNCIMLSNKSLLNLRARLRTLESTREITRARLLAGPMSERRVRGRRAWSRVLGRSLGIPRARFKAEPISNKRVRVRRVCSQLLRCMC